MLPRLEGGQAAYGQDRMFVELLEHKRNGVFVDLGANDGVTISNTVFLERELGWTGVAVEPIPSVFERLREERSCHLINGCVTPEPGQARFLEVQGAPNMLSTLAVNDTGLTARRLRKNARRHGAQIIEHQVECLTFEDLTERFSIKAVDFLSLDTEGGEAEILESIDFDAIPVRLISVENNYFGNRIRDYLESRGFLYLGTFGVDEIYRFGGPELSRAMA